METATGQQRGIYYGWAIVGACVISEIASNALPINAFSLFLRSWSAELGTPISTLQLGLAACGLICAFMSPVAGVLADKYPARLLLGAGLAGTAAFCFAISFVTRTWQYVALYATIMPVSLVLASSIPANAVVSRWFVRHLGLALGITAFGLGMAGVIMPPIIAVAMPALGWRATWRIAGAIIAAIILPLVVAIVRERPTARHGFHYLAGEGKSIAHDLHGGGSGGLRWRDILVRRNFWLLAVVYLPMLALYGGVGQNTAPIAASEGLSQHTAGVLLSFFSAAQLAATLLGGALSDRFGNRLPLAAMALATASGGLLVGFGHGVAMLGLGTTLAGVGGGFWPLLARGVAVEFGRDSVGRAFGLLIFFLPVAVLAPFVVAKSEEGFGSYAPALAIMAGITVLGGAAILLMRERQDLHEPPMERKSGGKAVLPAA